MSVIDSQALLDSVLAEEPATLTGPQATGELAFTIRRFVLGLLLEKAVTVVPTRDVMPVLKCFQIEATPGRLRVVASDMELSIVATTDLVEVTASGVAVFPARKLLDMIREADDADVSIRVAGSTAQVTVGRTAWRLRLASGADYPPMPAIADATLAAVDRVAFAAALSTVRYAACRDANRASLMMIDVTAERMTACDSSRFQQSPCPEVPFSMQIPVGAVDDLLKLLRTVDVPDIAVGQSDHHLLFHLAGDLFIVNKLVANFPDLEALWLRPAMENRHDLAVERADLLAAVRRVRINADPETSAIALELSPAQVTVSTRDKFGNHSEETVEADWSGPSRALVVNHGYLLDMIKGYGGPVLRFRLGEDARARKSPVLLRDPDTDAVGILQQMAVDWVTQQ